MSPQQLADAIGCPLELASTWAAALTEAMDRYGISGPNEMASFLSQVAHESAGLTRLSENLNYSAEGLAKTWPGRYRDADTGRPNHMALLLARNPVAIGNNCYALRMGNGDVASGDGWKYRGRGPIMITGKGAYIQCGKSIGYDLLTDPALLASDPRAGALSAGWFWQMKGLDAFDDDVNVLAETRRINGGDTGLAERQALFDKILKVLETE